MEPQTHDKLYSILLDMKQDIGELKANSNTLATYVSKQNGRVDTLEKKTENLEKFNVGLRAKTSTIASIFGIIASIGGDIIYNLVVRK